MKITLLYYFTALLVRKQKNKDWDISSFRDKAPLSGFKEKQS